MRPHRVEALVELMATALIAMLIVGGLNLLLPHRVKSAPVQSFVQKDASAKAIGARSFTTSVLVPAGQTVDYTPNPTAYEVDASPLTKSCVRFGEIGRVARDLCFGDTVPVFSKPPAGHHPSLKERADPRIRFVNVEGTDAVLSVTEYRR